MLSKRQLAELESLSRAQRRAWNYILEYSRSTGKRCFTYNSLQRYWPQASTRININTLERRLRELRELGILERRTYTDKRGRERAYYCIRMDLYTSLLGVAEGD